MTNTEIKLALQSLVEARQITTAVPGTASMERDMDIIIANETFAKGVKELIENI